MQVSRAQLNEYADTVDVIGADARASLDLQLRQILTSFDKKMPHEQWMAMREELIDALATSREYWSGVSASAAAEFYDSTVGISGKLKKAAVSVKVDRDKCADCVRSLALHLFKGEMEKFIAKVCDNGEYHVRRAANDTMLLNAGRDRKHGVKYARVPVGVETCAFCVMLAGRGFVYHSKGSAGKSSHYHLHCDCKIVCGFEGDTVEGYDSKEYEAVYIDARDKLRSEHEESWYKPTESEILNEMRKILSGEQ